MRALRTSGANPAPIHSASLESLEDIELEQKIESIRRGRVETERAEEGVKEFAFRRSVLVVVLCILGLVAIGAMAVVVTGIVAGSYPLVASGMLPLSSSGGLSVLAWRTYVGFSGVSS